MTLSWLTVRFGAAAITVSTVLACGSPQAVNATPERPFRSSECEEPPLVPFDTPPELVNSQEVARALEENYATELREAGVQGRSLVCAVISEAGEVTKTQVVTSSGHFRMDLAAIEVVKTMRFRPARAEGQAVPVKWTLPVTFRVR